jgi:hypothetical protein
MPKTRPLPKKPYIPRERKYRPPQPKPAFVLGPIETLRDAIKQEVRIAAAIGRGELDSLTGARIASIVAKARHGITAEAHLKIKHGNAGEQAKMPITVVREVRIERPPAGTPPKRPVPTGEPMIKPAATNGAAPATNAPPAPTVSPATASSGPPRPPRVLN